jgi:hypothetical protein
VRHPLKFLIINNDLFFDSIGDFARLSEQWLQELNTFVGWKKKRFPLTESASSGGLS